jgi:cytochrome c
LRDVFHTNGVTTLKLLHTFAAAAALLAVSGLAFAGAGEDIIAKEKCNKCHTEKTTKKGPSYASIAEKYKGNAAAPDKLFNELKNGGKIGDEDDHKKLAASDADIKAVVAVVLSSK